MAHSARLYDLLLVNDFPGLAALVESFFASIPYEWYTNNDIASYEGFYASVFYLVLRGAGTGRGGGGQQQSRLGLDIGGAFGRNADGSTCSSSRWWSWRPRARRSRS